MQVIKQKVFFSFFFGHVAYGILVPRPGIEPRPSAMKVRSANHWTAREFPSKSIFKEASRNLINLSMVIKP